MISFKKLFGYYGEDMATQSLLKLGYKIITRNYKTKHGEIDIIAFHNNCIVFIEVKTRSSSIWGNTGDFINNQKQHLIHCSKTFLSKNNLDNIPVRFDSIDLFSGNKLNSFSFDLCSNICI